MRDRGDQSSRGFFDASSAAATGLKSDALTRGGIGEDVRLIAFINQSISVVVVLAVIGIAISAVNSA